MPFDNVLGFLGLLGLIPLIILYLIKPKPKEIKIPTLMFMVREKESKLKSLIKKMLFDPLFLLQVLIIILISASMAKPYCIAEKIAGSENVAIVLDVSASMQAKDVLPSRFDKAIEIAKNVVSKSGKVSIILAAKHPAVLVEKGDPKAALALLDSVGPLDTPTNLVDAMELARSIVEKDGRIVVVSDFVAKGDILLEKKLVNANNIMVDFAKVGNNGKNVGIVDLKRIGSTVYVTLRNYDEDNRNVVLKVLNNNAEVLKVDESVQPKSSYVFILENLPLGRNVIEIESNLRDDFPTDNQAYIYIKKSKYKVLVLCEKKDSHIRKALLATNLVTIEESYLPIIPNLNDYDIVLVENVSIDLFPPGSFDDIAKFVKNGGNLIVASNNFELLKNLESILPVTVNNKVEEGVVTRAIVNEITKDVEFNFKTTYLTATPKNGSITIAKAESPVISIWTIGKGKAIYYGISENSSFYQKTSYPIFWLKIVEWLESSKIGDSYKTGEVIKLGGVNVEYDSKKFNTDTLLFEKTGFYKIGGEIVSVNLLDPLESDISNSVIAKTQFSFEEKKKEVKEDLTDLLIVSVILLVIGEIAYLKWRGDI